MKQLDPFTFELTHLNQQRFIAEWTPPVTQGRNYKGKTKISWEEGSKSLFIMVYKAHPNDLLLDEHLDFITNLPRRKKGPNKLGNWFNGYCYLVNDDGGTIKYQEYT